MRRHVGINLGISRRQRQRLRHSNIANQSAVPLAQQRNERLMEMVDMGRVDTARLVTHRFSLDDIERAYDLFAHQRDGVLKVAITP
ncbi:MAG TPA: hypothetical protein VK614_11550 [Allosphingosinicella sp.]|nr:hypothetical protein [Allosphingosinicella sp.]